MQKIDRQRLADDLAHAGILLNDRAVGQLWQFHQILRQQNQELNLTRLHSYDTMVRKHYIDCLLVPRLLQKHNLAIKGPVMDLGSGGGFPGIPLAIELTDIDWYLVEGRQTRTAYLQNTAEQIGLGNITAYWRKLQPTDSLPVQTVITRAVETMQSTADRISGCLNQGGFLIFMKGPHCDDEISAMAKDSYTLRLDKHYTLPDSTDHRRLVVFERLSKQTAGRPLRPYNDVAEDLDRVQPVTSAENVRFKSLKKIMTQGSKAVTKEGRTLVYGRRIVEEVLDQSIEMVEAVIVSQQQVNKGRYELCHHDLPVLSLSTPLISELGLSSFEPPYLICKVPAIEPWPSDQPLDKPTLFLPLGDPENLGSALRSALAFKFHRIVLLSEATSPFLPATIRASSAASLSPLFRYCKGPSLQQLANQLPENDFYYLDRGGHPLKQLKRPQRPFGLIVGEEGRGIPQSMKDSASHANLIPVGIEISNDTDSLNAAVSLALCLHHLSDFGDEKTS